MPWPSASPARGWRPGGSGRCPGWRAGWRASINLSYALLPEPADSREVMIEAMIESALRSARLAEETGLGHDRIIISAKVSGVQDLVEVYTRLAERCDYPLHLGLTEAGMGVKGAVASTTSLKLRPSRAPYESPARERRARNVTACFLLDCASSNACAATGASRKSSSIIL